MSDILAKNAARRASQRRSNGGAPRPAAGAASSAGSRPEAEGGARREAPDPRRPLAEPDVREAPPGQPGTGLTSAGKLRAADVRPGGADDDRILELGAREGQPGSGGAPAVIVPFGRAHARQGEHAEAARDDGQARGATPVRQASPSAGGQAGMREAADIYAPDVARVAPVARSARPAPARGSTTDALAVAICPICGGAGFVRLDLPIGDPAFGKPVPCACKERQLEDRRRSDLRRWSSLEPFREKTFDRFDARIQGLNEAFETARAFARDPEGWLVLSGPHGVGKTHLAAAVANWQLAQGTPVFFSIVPDLLDHLRAAFAPSSDMPYDEMFDKVRESGLLVLDDLGAENSTAWATEKLFQLMNYRYNFRMPTVITTNGRLLTQMDDRLRSRLSDIDLVRHVIIKAQDYREHHYREHRTRRQDPGRGEGSAPGKPGSRRGYGG